MSNDQSPRSGPGLRVAVALSGGGHRATLFGLGALMYLVDAERQKDTVSIASVSGGSLTNGIVAQSIDFQTATPGDFAAKVVKPLASQIAQRGTLFAPFLSKAYLVALVAAFLAVWLPFWLLNSTVWLRVLAWLALLMLWGGLFWLRGAVCAHAFRVTLFSAGGAPTRLGAIATKCSHVFCATELRAAQSVYFAGDFVYGFMFGVGEPGTLPLYRAVQASAAFPGGFPPVHLPTRTINFRPIGAEKVKPVPSLVLSDGGVYDNMGDQWARGFSTRAARWPWLAENKQAPNLVIVVNASARVPWSPFRRRLIPLVNEISALIRVNNVMYVNTTNIRRQDIVNSFDPTTPERAGPIPAGLVQIAQSPFRVADAYVRAGDDVARRAEDVTKALDPATRDEWAEIARQNAAVPTTLSKLGGGVSARLLRQGYVVAMCNLHVVFGGDGSWPLLPIPELERFRELASGAP